MKRTPLGVAALLVAAAAPFSAQSNLIPGTDVTLGVLGTGVGVNDPPRNWGRVGSFPDGRIGVSVATTSCNIGSVDVPWISVDTGNPMGDDHPYIGTLFARESDGRMVQISNYSDVKHGFFALTNEQCGGNCNQGPFGGGDVLGQGCSDTYGTFNNGDQYWLAPADEIDPWLGVWDPFGSHFDRGQPDVGAPNNNNGQRSLTNGQVSAFNNVEHRVEIHDEDLDVSGATFYYQGYYVIRGEDEAVRENNLRHRRTNVTMGGDWNFSDAGGSATGTVLNEWADATVTSAKNGNDDGRVYVAVVVTDNGDGTWHYEYALHNRDANRAVGAFRLPSCPEASVTGVGFHDVDKDAGNDWAFANNGSELVFSTGSNPLRWNSIYNFWFDSDAAPESVSVSYDPFFAGAGANNIAVASTAPTGLTSFQAGAGCSFGPVPSVSAVGQATLGNAAFAAAFEGNDPGGAVLPLIGLNPGTTVFAPGCELQMVGTFGSTLFFGVSVNADVSGVATVPLAIPNNPGLEGVVFTVQAFSQRGGGGPIALDWDLTDALRVRVGNFVSGCP